MRDNPEATIQAGVTTDLAAVFAPLDDHTPIAAGEDLVAVLIRLGAEIETESYVVPAEEGTFGALVRGTRYHFKLRDSLLSLGQIAWSVARLSTLTGTAGDAVTLAAGLARLKDSITKLDEASGEICAYVAVGRANRVAHGDAAAADVVAVFSVEPLRCGGRCALHAAETFDGAALHSVLDNLASRGVIKRSTTGWRIVV